jgi:lysophospholipase
MKFKNYLTFRILRLLRKCFPRIIVLILISGSGFKAVPAWAIPEEDVTRNFESEVLPYYEQGKLGSFIADDGLRIHFWMKEVEDERGALIISPGCGNPAFGYSELVYDLRGLGLSVYIIDHRGQGYSEKIADDPLKTHVGDFDHYVKDLNLFMELIVKKKHHRKIFFLGESMGGAVATQFALNYKNKISAMILSTPMLGINTGYLSQYTTHCLAGLGCYLGYGEYYIPGSSGQGYVRKPFEDNYLTHSQARYDFALKVFEQKPHFKQGGITYQWLNTSLSSIVQLQDNRKILEFPILLMKAGKDAVVSSSAQDQFCKAQEQCQMVEFEDSYHGLLSEKDSIRNAALEEIRDFLKPLLSRKRSRK